MNGLESVTCEECKGVGFWWKQKCMLELGAKFSEPEKVICSKCNGTGKADLMKLVENNEPK